MTSATCPSCGADVAERATSCGACGAGLAPVSSTGSEHTRGPGPAPPPPPGGGSGGPSPPPPGPGAIPATHPSGLSSEVRNWGLGAHLSSFAGSMVGLPLLGPLVVWLIKRDDHPFIEHHATEALNFNLSLLIYTVVGIVASVLTVGLGLIVFIPAAIVGGLAWIILSIVAAVRASNGESYRYPLTIRLVK